MAQVDGGGVRYNQGKAPYDMLPLGMMLDWLPQNADPDHPANKVLRAMASWQLGDDEALDTALENTVTAEDGPIGLPWLAHAARVFHHVTVREVKPYPKWNWMRGMAWSIPLGCVTRHALAWLDGQENDPETGLPHRGHIQCNLVMLKYYATHFQEGDDRPKAVA